MPNRAVCVAIYGRVSTGKQNPDAQLVELRAYAERQGFAVYLYFGKPPAPLPVDLPLCPTRPGPEHAVTAPV
jgi:hypothetical protein